MTRTTLCWLLVGWAGFFVLPWYVIEDGFWSLTWIADGYPSELSYGPAIAHILAGEKLWLAPLFFFLLLPVSLWKLKKKSNVYSILLILSGMGGLGYFLLQGFSIGISGWEYQFLENSFGPLETRQFGMGYGAMFVAASFLFLLTQGLAARGAVQGDVFVVASIGFVLAIVAAFIFFPVSKILISALQDNEGLYSLSLFLERFSDTKIWGIDCFFSSLGCGAAWNSLFLATTVGISTTCLGLAFALIVTRSLVKYKRLFRALSVLPIITPPFVIGLALILLFGLSGIVTRFGGDFLGVTPTRWIYGFPGIWLAQMLAYTPIAFLVLLGVVEGVNPSMEEASQTLGASSLKTFTSVSLPLMRPGLANAFLLGFIESMADFGNPLILGGNFDVLSTEIFFAIVGAQNDQGFAAVLAIVLLGFTLSAFFLQRYWLGLGQKSYTSITGKGSSQSAIKLPTLVSRIVYPIAFLWMGLTIVVYTMIIFGSFVEVWGLNHTLTIKHYLTAFSFSFEENGLQLTGSAWDSFTTTLLIAIVAAPLTAGLGLLTAYLLTRQRFAGKNAFEFSTMLSFAIPGTVIGVSYILSFNIPPLELTGSAVILVLCFIFRNMPVGVRAGIAAMSQIDKSLDEASLTLGANSSRTFYKVILPLLRPAIVAALVYSFVRAMTAISAVIFLVSAQYNMATSYIIGRVENNDYGLAIAYSVVLIAVMLTAVILLQWLIGEKNKARGLS